MPIVPDGDSRRRAASFGGGCTCHAGRWRTSTGSGPRALTSRVSRAQRVRSARRQLERARRRAAGAGPLRYADFCRFLLDQYAEPMSFGLHHVPRRLLPSVPRSLSGRDAVTIARGQGLALEHSLTRSCRRADLGLGFTLDETAGRLASHCGAATTARARSSSVDRRLIPLRNLSAASADCAVFPLRLIARSVDIRPDVICEPSGRRITAVDLPQAARCSCAPPSSGPCTHESSGLERCARRDVSHRGGPLLRVRRAAYDAIDRHWPACPGTTQASSSIGWTACSAEVAAERARSNARSRPQSPPPPDRANGHWAPRRLDTVAPAAVLLVQHVQFEVKDE